MKAFDFENISSPPPIGGTAIPAPDQGGVSSATRDAAAKTAREANERSPRRKRADGAASLGDAELQARINAKIAEQLESLHAPEMWEALLCMPGDAAQTITGKKRWEFSDKERRTIGLSGSALAQTMMITNPRALAAFMAISILGGAYLPRIMGELRDWKTERDKTAAAEKKPA